MRTAPRLFVTSPLPGPVDLSANQANYLRNVLRRAVGERVLLFNGRDGEWSAAITRLDKRSAAADADTMTRPQPAAPTLLLAFAPLKQARLDYMVEKAAEMGAGALQPVITELTQVRRINRERLQANVVEACEQCGVLFVAEVREPVALGAFLAGLDRTLVIADEALAGDAADPLATLRDATPPLAVLVGPEGGFSDNERKRFPGAALRLSLGPRILRADTAAVALLALVEATHPSAR